jgi:hypothetical protein
MAFDTIRTPFGVATEVLGGSANYFSVAASFLESAWWHVGEDSDRLDF